MELPSVVSSFVHALPIFSLTGRAQYDGGLEKNNKEIAAVIYDRLEKAVAGTQ
jgi:hypothetical protein